LGRLFRQLFGKFGAFRSEPAPFQFIFVEAIEFFRRASTLSASLGPQNKSGSFS
jgi:hypothetical protein